MDDRIVRSLNGTKDFDQLAQLEKNILKQGAMNDEVASTLKEHAAWLAREIITTRTGIDLSSLTPAEERIVQAASEYIGVMKRQGKNATRTLVQLRNRGLIDSAEISVSKSKPTQGFQTLKTEDLESLSYEQIILDYPDEFSLRAAWFARRTLGQPNLTDKPPAQGLSATQTWTEDLLKWLAKRARNNVGKPGGYSNTQAAGAIGLDDMNQYGRVFGNIVSRLDFACYTLGLPPLGLTATAPFDQAWNAQDRPWEFPVSDMQHAAQEFTWRQHDFESVLRATQALPGQAHLSWKKELTENAESIQGWAAGLGDGARESAVPDIPTKVPKKRNPDWSRDEHILGLDLYMRLRGTSYPDEHPEVIKLSTILRKLARLRCVEGGATFRNPNGVSMKMLNFRRLDPSHTSQGLPSGSNLEESVWSEFANDSNALAGAMRTIIEFIEHDGQADDAPEVIHDAPYWVFVCNPAKWAIDRFFASGTMVDTWGVRKSDQTKFAPGQLGIVRVGADQRSSADRAGAAPLVSGIYALLQVESEAFPGTGAAGEYWSEGSGRKPGWPTVQVRYLRVYADNPLAIERLRAEQSGLSHLLLNGFQGATFPISGDDFQTVMECLGEDIEDLPTSLTVAPDTLDGLAQLEAKLMRASPEVKTRMSKYIERGSIGHLVKKNSGYKCQLCDALGREPLGFKKKNGIHYIEAHHVMPVSTQQVGVLSASNIMTLCANHHREMHYGGVDVTINEHSFLVRVDGQTITINKTLLPTHSDILEIVE